MSLINLPNSPDQPPECRILSEDSDCDRESKYEADDIEAEIDDVEAETDDVDPFCCVDSDQDDGNNKVNPVLMNDIHLLKVNCPQGSCSYRILDIINEMDLDISFPTTTLQRNIAEAWGLNYGEPVVVRLSVNVISYLDSHGAVRTEVYHNGHAPGLLMQLKRIVQEFCNRQFRELSNENVQEALKNNNNSLKLSLYTEGSDVDAAYDALKTNNDKLSHMETDRDLMPQATANNPLNPEIAKDTPSLSQGFLVQLYLYIEQRLLTLNSFCPVCDNCHSAFVSMMLKPVVCSNPLCTFAYHTLGVMAGAADAIVSGPQVVQLLVYLTKAAVGSNRRETIFHPYPTIVHPTNVNELAMQPESKDYNLLIAILDKIPNVPEMMKYDETNLKMILQEKHELCEPLLRWIISSNRSHIVKLPVNKQLSFMGTSLQFLMRISPPLQDREFRKKKEIYGSVFAFHGSPIENWHCIIREGLCVASNTNKMINGQRFGRGIYISPHLGTSITYSQHYDKITGLPTWKKGKKAQGSPIPGFIHGEPESLVCIALCELIDCKGLNKFESCIWTMKQSENVCTRFFFVYDECNASSAATLTTMTTSPAIRQEIEMTLAAEG